MIVCDVARRLSDDGYGVSVVNVADDHVAALIDLGSATFTRTSEQLPSERLVMPRVVRFAGPRLVELVEEPARSLGPGEVRVATAYSGISAGTELTAYRGTNPYLTHRWDADDRLFVPGASTVSYPVDGWGYSEVGRVVEVAADVSGPAVGDLVWGIWGHREEAVVVAEAVRTHVLAPGSAPMTGVFARVGAIALNAVLASDVRLGETLVVFGQGVIGLLVTRLGVLSGAVVVAVDGVPARRAAALSAGAGQVLSPEVDVAATVRALTGHRGADVAVEISGSYRALHEAVRTVSVDGRVVAAGFYQGEGAGLRLGEEFHLNRVQVVASQIGGVPTGTASRWTVGRLQETFMRLVHDGRLDPVPLVTHVVPAAQVADAYELLDRAPGDALQVVLDFTAGDSPPAAEA
jgi:2-desacetyl-2-hydroxyethyl bacteriochlorophyllide A dehydrogenase